MGQRLCAQYKSKGAMSIEFESMAAVEYALCWLDRNKNAFIQEEESTRKDSETFNLVAHMMEEVFLVAKIKGLTQVRYLTLSEAKAMSRVESS